MISSRNSIRSFLSRFYIRLSADVLLLYLSRICAILLQSISLLILTSLIDIEEFGEFSFLYSAGHVSCVIIGLGGEQILLRELPARDAKFNGEGNYELALECYARCIAFAFLIFLITPALGYLFGIKIISDNFEQFALIIFTGTNLALLYLSISIVRVAKSATFSMMLRDFYPFLFFLIGVSIAYCFNTLEPKILILILCGAVFLCLLISIYSVFFYLRKRKALTHRPDVTVSDYLTFWGSSIVGTLFAQLDILLARVFLGDAGLGVYALLRRITNLVSLPQVIANWTISVRVARDFALNNYTLLQEHAKLGLWISLPIASLMCAAILVGSPIWLTMVKLSFSKNVFLLLIILLSAQLSNILGGANILFALQCHEERLLLVYRSVSLIIGALAMLLSVKYLADFGIAIGVLTSMVALNLSVLLHVNRVTGVWTSIPLRIFMKFGVKNLDKRTINSKRRAS